jgi:hypothetical protein
MAAKAFERAGASALPPVHEDRGRPWRSSLPRSHEERASREPPASQSRSTPDSPSSTASISLSNTVVRVMNADAAPKRRFLVLHDYGMGGVWWWVHARSAREVIETFAEVEVVDSPDTVEQAETWGLDEVDVDAPTMPVGLDGLRAQRDAQRAHPSFGALADRRVVHLRRHWDGEDDDDPTVYLMEGGSDGRRLRQVEVMDDGTAIKSGPHDWPFNPPVVDLFDPELAGMEVSREEFEAAWRRALSRLK